MPTSRGSEMPQRKSPRAPLPLRTSSSEFDGMHSTMTNRGTIDRSPKLGDRRSPRNPVVENRGTRISDLESQLRQAQDELKKLKEQLASAEAAKKEAQEELENARKQILVEDPLQIHESQQQNNENISFPENLPEGENAINENSPETDVFEVPAVTMLVEPKIDLVQTPAQEDYETRPIEECSEPLPELEKLSNLSENAELNDKLAEKEKELESLRIENEELIRQVSNADAEASTIQAKEEESTLKLSHMGGELEECKSRGARLAEELKATEAAKLALEMEVKKMKVQTDQWRKAADAAAAVLSGGAEMNGWVRERCGSTDKHLGGFDSVGYAGFGSPMTDELDDWLGHGKRKGGGIRMFGDLWKKKGQK